MKKFLIIAAAVLGFTSVSKAGVLFEPYIGYDSAKYSGTFTSALGGGTTEGKPTGSVLGLRLAYKIPMFWFGFDGSTESGKFNPNGNGVNDAYTKTVMGVVAGVDFPILLRAWVGYGFSNKIANKDTANSDYTGTNYKLGIGFTGLPFVSINLEMVTDNLTKFNDVEIGTLFSSYTSSSYLLSVSLPLTF